MTLHKLSSILNILLFFHCQNSTGWSSHPFRLSLLFNLNEVKNIHNLSILKQYFSKKIPQNTENNKLTTFFPFEAKGKRP